MGKKIAVSLLSIFFIIVNIILEGHVMLPWCDEVMFADAPVTFITTGEWTTTAWYDTGNGYGSICPSLFMVLQTIWGCVFGCSYVSFHIMNYMLMFAFVLLVVMFLRQITQNEFGIEASVLLAILLWVPMSMAKIYNNGRYEILCALLIVLIFISVYDFVKKSKSPIYIVSSTALLVLTALHPLPLLLFVGVFVYLFFRKGYGRKILLSMASFFIGIGVALFIQGIYLILSGRMKDYIVTIIAHSGTLKKIVISVLPLLRQHGINLYGWENTTMETQSSFIEKLGAAYSQIAEFPIFFAFIVLSFCVYVVVKKHRPDRTCILFAIFAVFSPLLMSLAGRFTSYYIWMSVIPFVITIALIYNRLGCKYLISLPACLSLYLAFTGLLSSSVIKDSRYDNVKSFVKQLDIKETEKAVVPFCMFYETKPFNKDMYFIQVLSVEHVPQDIDIVVTSKDADYQEENLQKYYEMLRNDSTAVLKEVASSLNPDLHAYRVYRK